MGAGAVLRRLSPPGHGCGRSPPAASARERAPAGSRLAGGDLWRPGAPAPGRRLPMVTSVRQGRGAQRHDIEGRSCPRDQGKVTRIVGTHGVAELAQVLKRPRKILLLVKPGGRRFRSKLRALLAAGILILPGGASVPDAVPARRRLRLSRPGATDQHQQHEGHRHLEGAVPEEQGQHSIEVIVDVKTPETPSGNRNISGRAIS